jgi:hypothetical protein
MAAPDIRCKGVHVKLDKETHANFKTRLIKHGVSMQEAFEEFARAVGADNLSANRLLEKMVRTKIKDELATVGLKAPSRRKPRYLSELDDEKLYDLINEEEIADEVEASPRGGRNETA